MTTMTADKGNMAGGISIHAVDIANGIPALDLEVRLYKVGASRVEIAAGRCDETGLLRHPVSEGVDVTRGIYEVEFEVGNYYKQRGIYSPDPSFLGTAIYRFGIDKVTEHFHLPFKFTHWGFSLFRGGA